MNSDNELIDLECGGGGKKVRQTVQWLKENRDFVCPECGTINPLNVKELFEGLAKLEENEQ